MLARMSSLSIMQESKVYFHPMTGEHFGMAVGRSHGSMDRPVVPNAGWS